MMQMMPMLTKMMQVPSSSCADAAHTAAGSAPHQNEAHAMHHCATWRHRRKMMTMTTMQMQVWEMNLQRKRRLL
jgi:hypothetical protein